MVGDDILLVMRMSNSVALKLKNNINGKLLLKKTINSKSEYNTKII